jgi:hypothetical protein
MGCQWQWPAYACGAFTGCYVFLVGIFDIMSEISGWYEVSCSIIILLCLGVDLGLLYGGVGYLAGSHFVHSVVHKNSI